MVFFAIITAALYALPNIYGEDPAIQVTGARGASVDMSTLDAVTTALDKEHLSHKSMLSRMDQFLFVSTTLILKLVLVMSSAKRLAKTKLLHLTLLLLLQIG